MNGPAGIRRLRAPLLRWYRRHRRDLPWRGSSDPYAIWVSEVMLQQTRAATVVPYFHRFLERFPSPARLADASEEEVLGAWSGLGYYRRARALHRGAQVVMERHGGNVPNDPAALRELPGVGRYTAGAIASMAFDLPEPILDGNVRRVLSRVCAVDSEARLWEAAALLVRGRSPGDLNQALMELGALVCAPRRPDCAACPARQVCRARRLGNPEAYPRARPRPATEKVRVAAAWLWRGDRCLVERPGDASPFRGTWDLPALVLSDRSDAPDLLGRGLRRRHGLDVRVVAPLARVSHGIMHRRLQVEVHRCTLRRGKVAGRPFLRWLERAELDSSAISGLTRKVFRLVGPAG